VGDGIDWMGDSAEVKVGAGSVPGLSGKQSFWLAHSKSLVEKKASEPWSLSHPL